MSQMCLMVKNLLYYFVTFKFISDMESHTYKITKSYPRKTSKMFTSKYPKTFRWYLQTKVKFLVNYTGIIFSLDSGQSGKVPK